MSQEQPASLEESLQMVLEHWSEVERERERNTFPLTDEERRKAITPDQMEDLMDSKNLASEHLDEMAEESFVDMWKEDVPDNIKPQIVERLLQDRKKDILGL